MCTVKSTPEQNVELSASVDITEPMVAALKSIEEWATHADDSANGNLHHVSMIASLWCTALVGSRSQQRSEQS